MTRLLLQYALLQLPLSGLHRNGFPKKNKVSGLHPAASTPRHDCTFTRKLEIQRHEWAWGFARSPPIPARWHAWPGETQAALAED